MHPTDARRFALAIGAVITETHSASHVDLGGWPRSPENAQRAARLLHDTWGVASAEDCAHTLAWLDEQGHSRQYADIERIAADLPPGTDAKSVYLSPEDAKSGQPPVWTEFHQKLKIVLLYRDRVGDRRLLAWDMGRLVAVAGWSALAGFIDEEEAWKWIVRAAHRAQHAYGSWRELGEHFVLGLAYWRPDRVGDAPAIIERLLADEASPWCTLPWSTELEGERGGEGESILVKVSRCHVCGAWKATRSKTAYVYCDFCATLIDWDFRVALTTAGSAMPGPKYEALRAELKPELDLALESGDRARYAAAQARLYDEYIDACPAAVPPRIGDPAYRARFMAYTVNATVEQDFDDDCRWLQREMDRTVKRLVWDRSDGSKPRVESQSFWELFRAVKARTEAALVLSVKTGNMKAHPDLPQPELLSRMSMSLFAQGWLPYLAPSDAERLLAETHLEGDYQRVELPPMEARHCGACGSSLRVVAGALRVVCDACGHQVDVGAIEITCTHCGGPLSIPAASDMFPCPYCRREVRAMRVPRAVPP